MRALWRWVSTEWRVGLGGGTEGWSTGAVEESGGVSSVYLSIIKGCIGLGSGFGLGRGWK